MNKIPIIRKGAIKDYLVNGFSGGFVVGVLAFLISLINSGLEKSLLVGLIVWIGIIILFIGVGFTIEERNAEKSKRILKIGKFEINIRK